MSAKAYWVKPPSTLAGPLKQYQQRVLTAIYAVAAYVGQQMQNDARRRAKWEDRTGNARSGLFFAVDGFGMSPLVGQLGSISQGVDAVTKTTENAIVSGTTDRLVLALSHTMYYGKFLELSNGGKYAIIMSTMEANLPRLEAMLKNVLR